MACGRSAFSSPITSILLVIFLLVAMATVPSPLILKLKEIREELRSEGYIENKFIKLSTKDANTFLEKYNRTKEDARIACLSRLVFYAIISAIKAHPCLSSRSLFSTVTLGLKNATGAIEELSKYTASTKMSLTEFKLNISRRGLGVSEVLESKGYPHLFGRVKLLYGDTDDSGTMLQATRIENLRITDDDAIMMSIKRFADNYVKKGQKRDTIGGLEVQSSGQLTIEGRTKSAKLQIMNVGQEKISLHARVESDKLGVTPSFCMLKAGEKHELKLTKKLDLDYWEESLLYLEWTKNVPEDVAELESGEFWSRRGTYSKDSLLIYHGN